MEITAAEEHRVGAQPSAGTECDETGMRSLHVVDMQVFCMCMKEKGYISETIAIKTELICVSNNHCRFSIWNHFAQNTTNDFFNYP